MRGRRDVLVLAGVALAGCLDAGGDAGAGNGGTGGGADDGTGDGPTEAQDDGAALVVTSPAFENGESIPTRYTGEGADGSPPLSIDGVPEGATSLALVVDDPDAPDPPFTHWLCWAIPPDVGSIPGALPQTERLDALDGAIQGTNDFGDLGYRGPLPPEGDGPHRYRFVVSALDSGLTLDPGADRAAVDESMAGAVLARGRLVGTSER